MPLVTERAAGHPRADSTPASAARDADGPLQDLSHLRGTRSRTLNGLARLLNSLQTSSLRGTLADLWKETRFSPRRPDPQATDPPSAPMPDLSQCSWLDRLSGIDMRTRDVSVREVEAFAECFDYPRYYYAANRRLRYALWHMVGFELCGLTRDSVVIDAGAQAGIWSRLARKRFGCQVWDVDLRYRSGVHGRLIGSTVAAIPLPDACATHVVSFCAFNCFEGEADTDLVREATRLLAPGGKLVIVPLCIADDHVNFYDPRIVPEGPTFDPAARRVPRPGWRNRFGRWYDEEALRRRICDHAGGFRRVIWDVRHPPFQPGLPKGQFYAAEFIRINPSSRRPA